MGNAGLPRLFIEKVKYFVFAAISVCIIGKVYLKSGGWFE